MSDPIGAFLSWTVIAFASAYVGYHWVRTIRYWRLETESAVAIMFGTGLLVMVTPSQLYPDLSFEARESLSWVAIIMILTAFAIDWSGERHKRDASSSETSSLTPPDN